LFEAAVGGQQIRLGHDVPGSSGQFALT
jgi:hypothetical protein